MAANQDSGVLTIVSPFPHVINMFPGEKDCGKICFADLLFVIGDKMLQLHRPLLSNGSSLMYAVLSCKSVQKQQQLTPQEDDQGDDNFAYSYDWIFDTSEKVDVDAPIMVLRFCYGEKIVLRAQDCEMCCAVMAAAMRLQIKCLEEVNKQIKAFVLKNAELDVKLGARLLRACVRYDELTNESIALDKELVNRVLTSDRLHGYFDVTVGQCLNMLPPRYLDMAHYGDLHSRCSSFSVRCGYLEANPGLDKPTRKAIMMGVKPEELNSNELQRLCELKLLEREELLNFFKKALLGSEKIVAEQERFCGSVKYAKLVESKAEATDIVAGTDTTDGCGALYVPQKHCIIRTAVNLSTPGRDIVVTTLTSATAGSNEVKNAIIPFRCDFHPPVFDGKSFAYFMQWTGEESGNRFGRLNLDNFTFQELQKLPSDAFGIYSSGCWHHGRLFAVKNNAEIWSYDPLTNSWQTTGTSAPNHDGNQYVKLLSDPEDSANFIYALGASSKNGLYHIDLANHNVELVSAPSPKTYNGLRDAVLLRIDATEFVVIADMEGGQWCAYSSKNNRWMNLHNWESNSSGINSQNTLVYASAEHTLFYQITGRNAWNAAHIDEDTFASY